jgi:hypothetical protein
MRAAPQLEHTHMKAMQLTRMVLMNPADYQVHESDNTFVSPRVIQFLVCTIITQEFGIPDIRRDLANADWDNLQDAVVKLISINVSSPSLSKALIHASGMSSAGLKIPNDFIAKQYANAYK